MLDQCGAEYPGRHLRGGAFRAATIRATPSAYPASSFIETGGHLKYLLWHFGNHLLALQIVTVTDATRRCRARGSRRRRQAVPASLAETKQFAPSPLRDPARARAYGFGRVSMRRTLSLALPSARANAAFFEGFQRCGKRKQNRIHKRLAQIAGRSGPIQFPQNPRDMPSRCALAR